jgi:DNA-binding protein YbaB
MDCVAFQIEPALLTGDDREVLEDLLTAAVNDALAKAKALQLEQMQLMPGGMPFSLPDMDESNSS